MSEIVEESPAPSSRPTSIPKRKQQPPSGSKKTKAPSNGIDTTSLQDECEALRAENERLRAQLEEAVQMGSKYQEDFNKLQNLRFSKPEVSLSEYIVVAEERERELREQNQALMDQIPRLREFLQPHSSGSLTILTREEVDHKLSSYRTEVQSLKKTIEEQNQSIRELEQNANHYQLQLEEEIKRSNSLASQRPERRPLSQQSNSRNAALDEPENRQFVLSFYEDITNIKIHNIKKLEGPDDSKITELRCDCTTYGKSLYFKLEMLGSATQDEQGNPVDCITYTPLGLENEKDPEFLAGLKYLTDTFTFNKTGGVFDKQMWEFGFAVARQVRAWKDGEDDEEDEEEEGDQTRGDGDDEVEILNEDMSES